MPESPTLMEEMTMGMALSMLVFLLADLRLLSGTGRIATPYERLLLDDDYIARCNATVLAGTDPASRPSTVEGLTPAQLMAIVLMELRVTADRHKSDKPRASNNELTDAIESYIPNPRRHRRLGDDMHALLKAYAEMLGDDLAETVPYIAARRDRLRRSNRSLIRRKSQNTHQQPAQDPMQTALQRLQAQGLHIAQATLDLNLSLSQRVQRHCRHLIQSPLQKTQEEMDQVTDTIFGMCPCGDGNGEEQQRMTPEELLATLTAAVESRDAQQLSFMSEFFRPGTLSRLMIESPTRVVWMNNWYPLKELTYAIAVDEERRRLLVIFRGAITAQDWSKAFESQLQAAPNPIHDDFANKPPTMGVYRGFYRYLFARRKDTSTTKFDEICTMADKYGRDRIGDDYHLVVTGHSLGAALSTLFGFYASLDERFTRNGPIKLFTYGSPYIGDHDFADCFMHQESTGKLMYARFYNHNDLLAYLPFNAVLTKRGSQFRHVGLGIKVRPVSRWTCRPWQPKIGYTGRESRWRSYRRALARNVLWHAPWMWQIPRMHSLAELQQRIMEGRVQAPSSLELLQQPIEELYAQLAGYPKPVATE